MPCLRTLRIPDGRTYPDACSGFRLPALPLGDTSDLPIHRSRPLRRPQLRHVGGEVPSRVQSNLRDARH